MRSGTETSLKLRRLLYLKIFTLVYQMLANYMVPFVFRFREAYILESLLLNFGFNILIGSSYFSFLSFWHIARGYDFINQIIEEHMIGLRPHSISHMWKIHINLGRTARRINGYFESQLLVLRLNHFLFSIIDFYMVFLFLNSEWDPWYYFYFGAILHLIRMLDFFLNDYILDLIVEYHNMRKDSITEGTMSKEVDINIVENMLIY
ncbi:putative gustatory receptor 59b [Drosophila serrata]|uniref:putative gustatory receptor 59b n=1 Tax=Drosophila serrata TaxID=7274 RepID=UPI000A1D0063|nr:putative gustatory receptor 59b [Drosophila serrata]